LIPAKAKELLNDFLDAVPIGPLEIETAWAGTFTQTEDGLPLIGQIPQYPGCHFALGYGGNDITFSLVAAQIIRDEILNAHNSTKPLFSFNRVSASNNGSSAGAA
jgi:glycine/D-amino acid oxidase-like deaminating enzyme